MSVLVLVDLANTPVFRGVHRPNPELIGARLEEFLARLVPAVAEFAPADVAEYRVRLYDGWFDETGRPTDLHGMLREHVFDAYPIRRRRMRLRVEVAEAPLAASGETLIGTVREYPGLGRYPVSIEAMPPQTCTLPGACEIARLRRWHREASCPAAGCPTSSDEVARFRAQKLVDTLIVADAVWAAATGEAILVVTDDEDVIPGLITARALGSRVGWVSQAPRPRAQYSASIARRQIEYFTC